MAFTTWAAYKTSVLDALVASVKAGNIPLSAVTTNTPDGKVLQFRSLADLEKHVDWVEQKVVAETSTRQRRLFLGAVQS